MTSPSLPDALATIARLDETMRPAAEAATQEPWFTTEQPWFRSEDGVIAGSPDGNVGFMIADCGSMFCDRDEYEGHLKLASAEADAAHMVAAQPINTLALLDATGALVAHIVALTKRAEAAERERDEGSGSAGKGVNIDTGETITWKQAVEQRQHVFLMAKGRAMQAERRATTAEAALATAQETIARLTVALEPFAAYGVTQIGLNHDHTSIHIVVPFDHVEQPRMAHFKIAARLLADLKPADATEADHG